MPFYDYNCSKCGHEWEDSLSMADKDKPLKKACPNCKKRGGINQSLCAPAIGDPVRLGIRKIDGGMKETFQKIKKANRGSTIPY